MYRKLIILFITVLLFSCGCKKYLDAKSNDELVVPDNLSALQSILDNGQYMNAYSPSMGEASADNYFLRMDEFNKIVNYAQEAYIWDLEGQSDYEFVGDWAHLYFIIYNANLCLEQLAKIPRTPLNATTWDNIKGAALFFRGRTFLQLSWIFSKAYNKETSKHELGVVLRMGSDFNVPSKRATVEESYQRILEDLKGAIPYLPNTVEYSTRPIKAAAYGYLSRTYLSMREYDSALFYANKCLEFNSALMDFNDPEEVDVSNIYPFHDFNKEIIHNNYIGIVTIASISKSYASIDTTLYDSYLSNDLRKTLFFSKSDGQFIHFYGSYKGENGYFSGIATDELYLVKAECEARKGQVASAMKDLNHLLITRWKTGTFEPLKVNSQEEALNVILMERRKELVFRGLRWMDIKRLNLEGANISIKRIINDEIYTLPANDNRFALPIPTDIINLTGIPQNPR